MRCWIQTPPTSSPAHQRLPADEPPADEPRWSLREDQLVVHLDDEVESLSRESGQNKLHDRCLMATQESEHGMTADAPLCIRAHGLCCAMWETV